MYFLTKEINLKNKNLSSSIKEEYFNGVKFDMIIIGLKELFGLNLT